MTAGRTICGLLLAASVAQPAPLRAQAGPARGRLPNGVTWVLTQANRAPKVEIRIVVDLDADAPALARLCGRALGALLADRDATRTRLQTQFAADFSAASSDGRLTLTGDGLSDGAPGIIDALARAARAASFTDAVVERARGAERRAAESVTRNPQPLAKRVLWQTLDPALARRDSAATGRLAQLTPADVATFLREQLVGAHTRVFVTGRFDGPTVRRAIASAFGPWPAGTGMARRASVDSAVSPTALAPVLVGRTGTPESSIAVGVLVPRDGTATLDVVDALLGAAVFSRITMNIREQKGYAYSPASTITNGRDGRLWVELADVARDRTGAALGEIVGELRRLGGEPVSAEELTGAQEYVIGRALFDRASRSGLNDRLSGEGGVDPDPERFATRVRAVTAEAVQAFARTRLARARVGIVVVGDADALPAQLAPFGYR